MPRPRVVASRLSCVAPEQTGAPAVIGTGGTGSPVGTPTPEPGCVVAYRASRNRAACHASSAANS